MPPGSCFRSNSPGLAADSSVRMRSRMRRTSSRSVSRRTHSLQHPRAQLPRSAAAAPASPQTARACSSAWCSQVQASRRWYSSKASMLVISMPPLPLGRRRMSTSYSRPAAECIVSVCTMRCTKRTKNTWLSTLRAPSVSWPRAGRIVQEHQVQVRGCSRARCRRACRSRSRRCAPSRRSASCAAHRRAVLRGHEIPADLQRLLDDEFGDLGQAVADAHQRQRTARGRRPRRGISRRAGNCAVPRPAVPRHRPPRRRGAARDRRRVPRASGSCSYRRSSISSSSSSGSAAICVGQEIAVRGQLDQSRGARCAFSQQQRKVGRTRADGLDARAAAVATRPTHREASATSSSSCSSSERSRRLRPAHRAGAAMRRRAGPGAIAPRRRIGCRQRPCLRAAQPMRRASLRRPAKPRWLRRPRARCHPTARAPRNARATRSAMRIERRREFVPICAVHAEASRARDCGSAGSECVCWSASICRRFSSRRRNS